MKKIIITADTKKKIDNILKKYKNFTAFSRNKNDAYKFTSLIGTKVCPYCNINYIYTVYYNKKQIFRPDIDHFEARVHRGKELDLNNLVPACNPCNARIKHKIKFTNKTHLHPYFDDFDNLFVFSVYIKSINYMNDNSFSIEILPRAEISTNDCTRGKQNIQDLKLIPRYQFHKNEVINIFHKNKFYHLYKAKELDKLLSLSGALTALLRIDMEERDINNIPLGKLKKDIHERFIK